MIDQDIRDYMGWRNNFKAKHRAFFRHLIDNEIYRKKLEMAFTERLSKDRNNNL